MISKETLTIIGTCGLAVAFVVGLTLHVDADRERAHKINTQQHFLAAQAAQKIYPQLTWEEAWAYTQTHN